MVLYVEEIGAVQVRISLRLPGVDGIRVDGGPKFGFADVIFITFQDAGDRSEFSRHIRDHHVLDLELGRGVNAMYWCSLWVEPRQAQTFRVRAFRHCLWRSFYSSVLTLVVIPTICPCMHPQCRTVGPDLRPRQALQNHKTEARSPQASSGSVPIGPTAGS